MRAPNIFDRYRDRVEALNQSLKRYRLAIQPSTADYSADARKPFALYSCRGDYIARYGSIERAEMAARRYDRAARGL